MQAEEILKQYADGERNFSGINITEVNLSRANLTGIDFSDATLSIANFTGANLSEANLSGAKLNVAKMSGANFSQTKFNGAILNVANLVRANLKGTQLIQAALIRAELIRADLTGANLREANLSGADLREAQLKQVNLSGANLSEADLRGASLVGANLEHATLSATDLSRSDLSGADLSDTELRHANLSRVNLSGTNLSGANLRWADLSGANLRWADLTDAKLSGANLLGADLTNANLTNASFVHADLTQANLIRVEWVGADLSGATLTGSKLFAVARYDLKTEGINCEWVDLSAHGDRSKIYRFTSEQAKKFFNQTPPTVRIIVDEPNDPEANLALATTYYQIYKQCDLLQNPPSIEGGFRRTELIFKVETDEQIFSTAYLTILPFESARETQINIVRFMKMLQGYAIKSHRMETLKQIKQLSRALSQIMQMGQGMKLDIPKNNQGRKVKFLQAATQVKVTNSSDQTIDIYQDPGFGQRLIPSSSAFNAVKNRKMKANQSNLPSLETLVDFVQGFYYLEA
jgi:uncharacterized protein YjbI with pentapeptide repeats